MYGIWYMDVGPKSSFIADSLYIEPINGYLEDTKSKSIQLLSSEIRKEC